MNKFIAAVSALTLIAVAGCTSTGTRNTQTTVSTAITFPPMFKGQHDELSSYGPVSLKIGDPPLIHPGLFRLRVCNDDKSECKIGVAKLKAQLKLVSLNESDATLKIDLKFNVDQSQTLRDDLSKFQAKMPDDVPIIQGDYNTSEDHVTVPYNRVGRIDLPYGVAYKFCVQAPTTGPKPSLSGCPGAEVVIPRAQQ